MRLLFDGETDMYASEGAHRCHVTLWRIIKADGESEK